MGWFRAYVRVLFFLKLATTVPEQCYDIHTARKGPKPRTKAMNPQLRSTTYDVKDLYSGSLSKLFAGNLF